MYMYITWCAGVFTSVSNIHNILKAQHVLYPQTLSYPYILPVNITSCRHILLPGARYILPVDLIFYRYILDTTGVSCILPVYLTRNILPVYLTRYLVYFTGVSYRCILHLTGVSYITPLYLVSYRCILCRTGVSYILQGPKPPGRMDESGRLVTGGYDLGNVNGQPPVGRDRPARRHVQD